MNTWCSRAGSAHTRVGVGRFLVDEVHALLPDAGLHKQGRVGGLGHQVQHLAVQLMPFCKREKSSSSSTIVYRRSVSVPMTESPRW